MSLLKKIVIFGAGAYAKIIIDLIKSSTEYCIFGLIDKVLPIHHMVYGYEILGDESILLEFLNEVYGGVVAIGDNVERKKLVEKVKKINPNFQFVSVIHPSAIVSRYAKINEGTVVMAGAIINCYSFIGEHCIINTNSSVDHDCFLGDYASIATGATLGGNVKVGEYSAISLGVNVIDSINIGEHTLIGAGSTVVRDISPFVVADGLPAKKIRTRAIGEKYIS